MPTLTNTDLQLFSNPFTGYGGYSTSIPLYNQQSGMGAAFAGLASPSQSLPLTAAGFLRTQFPEFSGQPGLAAYLSPELQQRYTQFASQAVTPEGLQSFRSELAGREDVQGLLRRQELAGASSVLRGVEGGRALGDVVSELLAQSGSSLANIYGGISSDVVSRDLGALLRGEQSAVGNLAAMAGFGTRGQGLTPYEAQAFGSQLLGGAGDMVQLGGGLAFNPYSSDVDVSGFTSQIGQQALGGTNLLDLNLGLLSLYDTNITGDIAGNISRAFQTGADVGYGGAGGYGTTTRLANIAPWLQQSGGEIAQGGDISGFIDATYRGLAGRGYGGTLPGLFNQYFQPSALPL